MAVTFYYRAKASTLVLQETDLTGDGATSATAWLVSRRVWLGCFFSPVCGLDHGPTLRSEAAATPLMDAGSSAWWVRLVVTRDGSAQSRRWMAAAA
jgi:hypothetical protein